MKWQLAPFPMINSGGWRSGETTQDNGDPSRFPARLRACRFVLASTLRPYSDNLRPGRFLRGKRVCVRVRVQNLVITIRIADGFRFRGKKSASSRGGVVNFHREEYMSWRWKCIVRDEKEKWAVFTPYAQ